MQFCIVQLFQQMDAFGVPLTNEFDCQLYQRTTLFRCVSSQCISHSVSVIHECTPTCVFKHVTTTTSVERHPVDVHKLAFQNDFANDIYCLNRYCMHSLDTH